MTDDPAAIPPAEQVVETLETAKEDLQRSPLRRGQIIDLPPGGTAVLTGDLHDHRTNFRKAKYVADLAAGADRHLVLHELIHGDHFDADGNEDSWRMLYQAAELSLDFPEQVHFVLANHDLAQIHGEGISKGGKGVCEAFTGAIKRDFGDRYSRVEIAVTEFLLALPLAVRSKSAKLFFCHSIPAEHELDGFDYDVFAREQMEPGDYRRKTGAAYQLIWGRGVSPERAAEFADSVGADVVVTGHQPQDRGWLRNGDRHLILASDHARGVCLPVPLDKPVTMDDLERRITPFVAVDDSGDED